MRGLRVLAIVVAVYGVVWISMEGEVYRVVIMAIAMSLLMVIYLAQRFLGGRKFSTPGWAVAMAGLGLLFGLSCGLFTLLFMAVKTGLHGHGPEFTQEQIVAIIRQIPLWGAVGLIGGIGLGLISTGIKKGTS